MLRHRAEDTVYLPPAGLFGFIEPGVLPGPMPLPGELIEF
jgi:hypothetical protein